MFIKDIVVAVIIGINIVLDSLIIWSSGNILPPKNDTNTTNTTNTTNVTMLYLDILDEGENMFIDNINSSNNNNTNISSNLPQIKIHNYDEYGIEDMIKFYNKSHKGLFFTSVFAFVFIIMLGFSYLVKYKDDCSCDLSGGCSDLSCSGGGGGGAEACGFCLAFVFLIILALIYLVVALLGKKYSRIFSFFGQIAFAILYIVFGYLKGKEDGVYKFVLLTIIVGGITVFFNFVAMILIIIDIDTCTFFGLIKRHNEENEDNNNSNSYKSCSYQNDIKTSDENTPNPPEVELKTSTDNNNSDSEQNNPEPNSGYDNNNGNINEGNEKEALISSSTQ